jgi:hypothetical protein
MNAIQPLNFGYGIHLDGATNSKVINCTATANQVGFFNNIGAPQNTFLGDVAENNSSEDYSPGIPQGPTSNVVTFTKSTGAFSGPGVTPPTSWSNIEIKP